MAEIDELLAGMCARNASDLHLKVGSHPMYRVHGELLPQESRPRVTAADMDRILHAILNEDQQQGFAGRHDVDFAYRIAGGERFRCNCFHDHRGAAAVFRRVPPSIPGLEELDLPETLESFAHLRSGLVLVTGATGSGKSTTLAALLQRINEQYQKHIITLEDPIEYEHVSLRSVIHQRGLHTDFLSFSDGIRTALRQDPDVLLIGEMRDLETIRLALTAAESGVLVYSTLHCNGAAESIDRISDVFPHHEQSFVRALLSQTLGGVIHQVLLHRLEESGRIPATEVLVNTAGVSNLIREGKTKDLATAIQAGRCDGMHTLDDSLASLVNRRAVSVREARYHADNKKRFTELTAGIL